MQEQYMRRALELARQAAELGEVPVGCVVVRKGEVVGEGYNRRETGKNALYHAELIAINDACRRLGGWRLHECSLYVTLEPCPMCAGAIINARVARVYYGACDPKAGALGSRLTLTEFGLNHRPEITGGLLAEEAAALLSEFFRQLRETRRKNTPGVDEIS